MLPDKRQGDMPGKVITFYSYKGGVGRSFILANVATQLALWGYKVLCVDWDLEAPGLTEYFLEEVDTENIFDTTDGIVDLMLDCQKTGNSISSWKQALIEVPLTHRTTQGISSSLDLISAGKGAPKSEYIDNVHDLNWDKLYGEQDFAKILDDLKREWKKAYDVILIDSRTGISDVSGICTVQLPDILALIFTPNKQSLEGVFQVAERAVKSHSRFPLSEGKLITIPIISRLDQRDEITIAASWLARVNKVLAPLYDSWLNKNVTVQRMQDFTKIPYITRWSFGENLAVLRERGSDPEQISYSFQSLAALFIEGIDHSADFTRGRDEFIHKLIKADVLKKDIEVIDPLARRLLESQSTLAIAGYAKELQKSDENLSDANALWVRAIQLDPRNKTINEGYLSFLKMRLDFLKRQRNLEEKFNEKINIDQLIDETEKTLESLSVIEKPVKVFISYSHESDSHQRFVLSLSDRLRRDGIDCMIDQYLNSLPLEGWKRWLINQVQEADFVLVIFTERYLQYFKDDYHESLDGLAFEQQAISTEHFKNKGSNTKIIPITTLDTDIEYIPKIFQEYAVYRLNSSSMLNDPQYKMLYRRLTGQPQYSLPPMGAIKL